MINSIRQTVMSVLNKNNYGYISPSDFNLFAKQAQMDLFENYFYQYNNQINKENGAGGRTMLRTSGTGYADITQGLEEVIDSFSEYKPLQQNSPEFRGAYASLYFSPSLVTTGDEWYRLNKVLVYSKLRAEGTTDSILSAGATLVDLNADFNALGVQEGDHIVVIVDDVETQLIALSVSLTGQAIQVNRPILTTPDIVYTIFDGSLIKEAERVSNSKITMLNNSILTKPTLQYPSYTEESSSSTGGLGGGLRPTEDLQMYPNNEINKLGQVMCQYIRYPFDPKWTYGTLPNGEPSFDGSSPEYQDFELPLSDEPNLVNKILQYAGMSIREISVAQFGKTEETQNIQQEN